MGIRASSSDWARARPWRAITVIVASGLAVSGVVGLGAGYKIEQHRLASSMNRLRVQVANRKNQNTPATTRETRSPASPRFGLATERVGTVTAVAASTLTLATKRLGVLHLHLAGATRFERSVIGTKGDVSVGRRVLIPIGGHEVLVLSSASSLGRRVTHIATDSFSVTEASGAGGAVVSFAEVKLIDTIAAASRSDVTKGSKVIVAGRATKGSFTAGEVILLATGSAFAN